MESALYLLDANVLIDAGNLYYPMDRVPEFWEWLAHQGKQRVVGMPREIFEEPKAGDDDVAKWLKRRAPGSVLLHNEAVRPEHVRRVIRDGYAPDLAAHELDMLGKDPFLIACALVDPVKRCVVSTEVSKPSKKRSDRKVPDVCRQFGIRCINTFQFIKELNFSTNWDKPSATKRRPKA
jgi:hypothetical protein